ncbi:dihydrodipicolinate synthase family protein [Gracilibacillus timonensis]|uniref:dihydrodipicolinate synthase family protein n=1 Tax=Gracilibacillus timonensis TaxID=1816696 RepID=UPI000825719C|nr:dihydrodipicolinate synthase family protein [Gracilibacillus timonensis]
MNIQFHGVVVPVPTILYRDGQVDEKGMRNLIDFLIESKVNGLFFLGSGGEFAQMSVELRKKVAAFATQYVNGRVPVLIGTGTPSTKETIALSTHAQAIGADAVVVINPYYYHLAEEHLFQYFSEVADQIELPIILYNYPALTGQDLTAEFVLQLAKTHSNIVGIKETVESIGHTREMIQTVKSEKPDFAVFSGYDDHFLSCLVNGGDGSIPLTASFVPEFSVGIYQSFTNNNFREMVDFHRKLAPLLQLYKLDTPFMNVAKEAIRARGIEVSTDVLAPARSLSIDKVKYVKDFLENVLNK